MTLIKKKHLRELGFTRTAADEKLKRTEFSFNGTFKVILTKGDKDNPEIMINDLAFLGAYSLKDLKDLLFMYYGERGYNDRFPGGEIKIKEVTYTKPAMLKAFEAGFFHAVPNMTINVDAAENWFKEEFENETSD